MLGGRGQFHVQVESSRVRLGIVALTPVTAAESRGGPDCVVLIMFKHAMVQTSKTDHLF